MKELPRRHTQPALSHRARGGGVPGAAQSSLGAAADHGNDDRRADDQRCGTAADAQPAAGQGGPRARRASDQAETTSTWSRSSQAVLRLWSASHKGLRQGDRAMRLPGRNSKAVRDAFDEIEPPRITRRRARCAYGDRDRRRSRWRSAGFMLPNYSGSTQQDIGISSRC